MFCSLCWQGLSLTWPCCPQGSPCLPLTAPSSSSALLLPTPVATVTEPEQDTMSCYLHGQGFPPPLLSEAGDPPAAVFAFRTGPAAPAEHFLSVCAGGSLLAGR